MNLQIFQGAAILFVLMQPAFATTVSRQANIIGGGGIGRCTVEVNVDGTAEVTISGDTGLLRTLSGQPAYWRRFECSGPMPRNPVDFRFIGIHGRGTARLLRDPRSNGGSAVVRIDDPKPSRDGYSFDLQWRGTTGGGWPPGPPGPPQMPPPNSPGNGPGPGPGGFPMTRAVRACQDSVTNRLNRDGYPYVTFEYTVPDNKPGRNDWLVGSVSGKRGFQTTRFWFSCAVDFHSATVRSLDLRRQ